MTICIADQHFYINKLLLLAVGLWPYHQTLLTKFHMFFFLILLGSFIIVQFTAFVTAERTSDFAIKVFSAALFFTMYLIKYILFYINVDSVKCLLDKLQEVCNELKNEDEIAIIRQYGKNAEHFTKSVLLFSTCNLFILLLLPTFPRILGIFMLLNVSQTRFIIPITREYFIDQEKYFYLVLFHMDAAFFIGAVSLLGTGMLLVSWAKHVCGILKIASYRIEHSMTIAMLENCDLSKEYVIIKNIAHAVDMHRKGMESCETFRTSFGAPFCLFILVAVICLSLNLYKLVQVVILGSAVDELLTHSKYILVILIYLFLINYCGQEVTDHSCCLFNNVYNVHWYLAPLCIQKIILFLLQSGTRNFYFVLGGLFVPSIESAAMLLNTSVSFFTVLYSTWQEPV